MGWMAVARFIRLNDRRPHKIESIAVLRALVLSQSSVKVSAVTCHVRQNSLTYGPYVGYGRNLQVLSGVGRITVLVA